MVLHPAKDGKVNKITFYKYIKDLDVEKAITDLEAKGNRSVRGDTLERYNKAKEILSDPASYNELYADTIVNYTKEFDRATGAFVVAPGHDDFGQDKKDIAEKLAAFIKSKGQMGAKRIEMAKYLIDNVLSKEEAAKWDAKNTNLTSKYDRYLVEKLGIFRIGSRFVSKEFLPDNADQITQPNIDSDKSEPTIDKIDDVTSILEPSSSKSDEDDIIDDSIQESYITKQKRKLLESYMHMLGEGKDRNSLPTQKEVEQYLMKFYPQDTENKLFHDHYGLYSKTPNNTVNKILLCTTATYEVVQKFKAENFDLLVSHHDNIARVPQIIFHSIMDEAEAGHNVYFAKRMGLQNFKKGEVSCAGEIYKPLTLDEFLVYLNKHGFEVKGVIHKNNTVKRDNDLIKSVVYTAGLGGMLINDQSLQGMGWEDNPLFDFRNIEADVYVTGQVISKYDLDNNKFKYIIELSHTTSEKPLFKRIHNQLKNRWPKLTVEVTDNEIDYFGQDRSNKYPEDDFVDPEDEIEDETDLDLEPDTNIHESSKKNFLSHILEQ
jgi:putative NIF3 family GTP cyclohydrolase 1 type 2